MRRIVFVDDERHVLDGLRDLLRRHRKRWEMHFVNDAKTAMTWMAEKPFDVVVSDMRMPGVDGAALLAHVKTHYSSTARIILSGQADRERVLRALPAAHHFLSKPCDPETLLVVIERACRLQDLLSNPRIRDIVGRLDRLPPAPQMYWDLTIASARPETGRDEMKAILERDPAMAEKLLQLFRSECLSAAQRFTSLDQALASLGADLLKALVLSVHALDALDAQQLSSISVEGLQRHSYMTAHLAKELAPNSIVSADAFAAALLHDVGQLVLARGIPERFAEVLVEQRRSKRPVYEVENERLGTTHAEVGAYLLGSWGLPLTMVETVAYHHIPSMVPDSTAGVLAAVHIADALMNANAANGVDADGRHVDDLARVGKLDLEYLEQTSRMDELSHWREIAAKIQREVG